MNKTSTFLFGLVAGASLMYVGLKYHVVRASDGFHMITKTRPQLSELYTDVRDFTVDDWRTHKNLMIAITESNDDALKEEAARSTLGNTFDNAWDNWTGATP